MQNRLHSPKDINFKFVSPVRKNNNYYYYLFSDYAVLCIIIILSNCYSLKNIPWPNIILFLLKFEMIEIVNARLEDADEVMR